MAVVILTIRQIDIIIFPLFANDAPKAAPLSVQI
jgi:hypothetical protein